MATFYYIPSDKKLVNDKLGFTIDPVCSLKGELKGFRVSKPELELSRTVVGKNFNPASIYTLTVNSSDKLPYIKELVVPNSRKEKMIFLMGFRPNMEVKEEDALTGDIAVKGDDCVFCWDIVTSENMEFHNPVSYMAGPRANEKDIRMLLNEHRAYPKFVCDFILK